MMFDLQLFGGGGTETKTDRVIPDQTPAEAQLEGLLTGAATNRLDFSNNQLFNDFRSSLGNAVDNIDWAGLMNQVNDLNMNAADKFNDESYALYNTMRNEYSDAAKVFNDESYALYDTLNKGYDDANKKYDTGAEKANQRLDNAQSAYSNALAGIDDEYKTGLNNALGKYEDALAAADSEYRSNQGKNLADYTNTMRGYLGDYEGKMNKALSQYQNDMGGVNSKWEDLTNGILPDSFATHRQAALNADMEGTVGNSFNNLANRGIINSAVTNKAMDDISQNASDTLAKMWSSDMALEADLLRNRQGGIQSVYDTTASNAGNVFQNQSNTENQRYNNATNYYGTLLQNANQNANSIYDNTANALGSIAQNQRATADSNWGAANTVYNNNINTLGQQFQNRQAHTDAAVNYGGAQLNNIYNAKTKATDAAVNYGGAQLQNIYNNYTNSAQNTMNNALNAQTSSFGVPTQYNAYMDSSYTPASNLYGTMYGGRMGTGSTTTTQSDGGAGLWGAAGSLGAAAIVTCFTGHTLVTTPKGYKYIRDIRVGDDVLSVDDGEITVKKVARITKPEERFIVKVYFNDGTVWHTTSFQRVYDGQHFHSITTGRTAINNDLLPRAIVDIEYTREKELVYDIAVEGFAGENVFFANDIAAEGIGE